ncbi:MAG: cupin domain-containing protein [Muribaculaceae bacterium]|nr:cupin domain-containing protein [Muribaculaceae bacterium]MDE5968197.1 cupin domain-containing protein [Muribaculaceae bacterium]MDE7393238.1 cupin domain-containing protein [Muribaculaceae bacterium]
MSEIKVLNNGAKFTHATVGALKSFEGKQFVKDATGATSCEISFGTLPTGAEVPFFHSHKANEENYIILSGSGRFQVDTEAFDVAEGSVIRVATNCDRNIKCTSAEPMVYICIQAKQGSLGGYTMTDAEITERQNLM